MIVQYLIDWKSVKRRVDGCGGKESVELLQLRLQAVREKITNNGVLIVDGDSEIEKALHETIMSTDELSQADEVFSYLKAELECFQTLYENRRIAIEDEASEDDAEKVLEMCVQCWSRHVHGVCPGISQPCAVLITDEMGSDASLPTDSSGVFTQETLETYKDSAIEKLRAKWNDLQSFDRKRQDDFLLYLGAYAASSTGQVSFFDPYWAAIGKSKESDDQRRRYEQSTKSFFKVFAMNPKVKTIDYVAKYDTKAECFCLNNIKEVLSSGVACRKGDLRINVILLDRENGRNSRMKSEAVFHNRYIVNDLYAVVLPDGMDVYSSDGRLRHEEFKMQRAGATESPNSKGLTTLLRMGGIKGYGMHQFSPTEIDFDAPPYESTLRDRPSVKLVLNGIM